MTHQNNLPTISCCLPDEPTYICMCVVRNWSKPFIPTCSENVEVERDDDVEMELAKRIFGKIKRMFGGKKKTARISQ